MHVCPSSQFSRWRFDYARELDDRNLRRLLKQKKRGFFNAHVNCADSFGSSSSLTDFARCERASLLCLCFARAEAAEVKGPEGLHVDSQGIWLQMGSERQPQQRWPVEFSVGKPPSKLNGTLTPTNAPSLASIEL